ncbi:hypothetical protein D0Z00_004577 [Geotrichum galactomycetum]|uniref:Uncharacterized protein n=1 Tax=Geotrichum galactomycetum TaxID=27317 RepID=A0ACB6UY13_9ASCO|nr:hypothetical protein D0Z00_004577 [Geotrichum candidum]
MSDPTIETLQKQVDFLTLQVQKNTKTLLKTGQKVLEYEVNNEKAKLHGGNTKQSTAAGGGGEDEEDEPVKGQDLVELVTELQTQLDLLDTKSIRRNANGFKTNDDEYIAPLPNNEGEIPPVVAVDDDDNTPANTTDGFPATLGQLKALSDAVVERWLRYYELLPPDEAELKELFGDEIVNSTSSEVREAVAAATAKKQLSKQELDAQFDDLARFLGLRVRRSPAAW